MIESSFSQSVTVWLQQLKEGDSFAAQKLWTYYVTRLVRMADKKLGQRRLRLGDGEDVAIIAFTSFLKCVDDGRFSRLDDRNDLWQVLVMLTDRKAKDYLDMETAVKRGADQLVGESAVNPRDASHRNIPSLDVIPEGGLTPEFALQFAEEMEIRFDQLADEELRRIALAKLEGYSNQEIADEEGISLRSVERRLALIRNIWEHNSKDE